MSYFEWSSDLSVKVETFDNHHKKLVDLLNMLHSAMAKGQGKEKVAGIITELANYTKYHFAEEERQMKIYNYSGYEQHRKEHEAFVKKVEEFAAKLEAGSVALSVSVLNFLRDWLSSHILKTDKQYSILFSSNRVA